jgi:hypothetical protein
VNKIQPSRVHVNRPIFILAEAGNPGFPSKAAALMNRPDRIGSGELYPVSMHIRERDKAELFFTSNHSPKICLQYASNTKLTARRPAT